MDSEKPKRIRRPIPVFGVALIAALALSAMGASAAQAFEWQIKGQTFKELGITEETFSSSGGALQYTWKNGGETWTWSCGSESSTGVLFQGGTSQTVFKWSECKFTSGVPFAAKCGITPPIESTVKSELVEVKGAPYEKFSIAPGGSAMKVNVWACLLEGTWAFSGNYAAKIEPLGTQLSEQPLTFSQITDQTVGTAIFPAGVPTAILRIDGSLKETLTGKNAGKSWGAK